MHCHEDGQGENIAHAIVTVTGSSYPLRFVYLTAFRSGPASYHAAQATARTRPPPLDPSIVQAAIQSAS